MALGKLTAKTGSEEGAFEPVPEGQQLASLIGIIDEGTQDIPPNQHNPEWTKAHKVLLVWEMLENKKEDGSPMFISEEYTLSMDVKANLRKMVQGWLGKTFKDGEEIDWTAPAKEGGILGRYCYLTVEHGTSKKNRKFGRLLAGSVQAVPKVAQETARAVKPQTTPFTWAIEEPEMPLLADELYPYGKKLADTLTAAHERANMNAQHSQESEARKEPPAQIEKGEHGGAVIVPGSGHTRTIIPVGSGITPPKAPPPSALKKKNAMHAAAQQEALARAEADALGAPVDDDNPF